MREIKVRAWFTDGIHKTLPGQVCSMQEDRTLLEFLQDVEDCAKEHGYNYILEQSTSLKDKNEKESYFEDIVKWNNKLWVVVWSITLSSIELQPLTNYRERQKNPEIKRLYGTCFGIGQAAHSEIIGTIHDKKNKENI